MRREAAADAPPAHHARRIDGVSNIFYSQLKKFDTPFSLR
jgi:hypothetical protein